MTKELIDQYLQNNTTDFAVKVCEALNDEIFKIWNEHEDQEIIFIHISRNDINDNIQYYIDFDENSFPETLCIKLTKENKNE